MYVRLVIGSHDPDSHQPAGVFQSAYDLHDSDRLSPQRRTELRAVLSWFSKNLHCPEDFDRDLAIFWFKSEAAECMKKIWELIAILEAEDFSVEKVWTDRPGYVVYQDQYQIAAIPFRDTLK